MNSGSSSLKFALFSLAPGAEVRRLSGGVDRIGLADGRFWWQPAGAPRAEEPGIFPDHRSALRATLDRLASHAEFAFDCAGHRLVSGGPRYLEPCRIDAAFRAQIGDYVPFAPLHLPAAIAGIEAIASAFPDIPQVACFDTSFHRDIPERASRLPLPRTCWDEGLRNYGFHGLSYEYIVDVLGGAPGRTVIAHLGNGASLAAVRDGISIDTTMGLSPTAGLIMGSRSGDVDPGVLLYLLNEKHLAPEALDRLLNKRSGLLGISGLSSDMQTLLGCREREPHAAIAIEMFCYSARKHVAAMTAALGGLDTLVFTGGIGERAAAIRHEICLGLEFLGVALEPAANASHASSIGAPQARADVLVIPTDEERTIARHASILLG